MNRQLWLTVLCDGSGQKSTVAVDSHVESGTPAELKDGSYSCDAYNSTRGNGPYSLDCDKSGDTVTIHFSNGGYLDLDLDSQESVREGVWEIEATNAANDDSWEITVAK